MMQTIIDKNKVDKIKPNTPKPAPYQLTTTEEHTASLNKQVQSVLSTTEKAENRQILALCYNLCYNKAPGIISYGQVGAFLLGSPLMQKYMEKNPQSNLHKTQQLLLRRLSLYYSRILILYKLIQIYSHDSIRKNLVEGLDLMYRKAYIMESDWASFQALLAENNMDAFLDSFDTTQKGVNITDPLIIKLEKHIDILVTNGLNMFKTLYKHFKRTLDLFITSMQHCEPDHFSVAVNLFKKTRVYDNTPVGEPVDSHYYFELLKSHLDHNIKDAVFKLFPEFSTEEKAQVDGYLREQVIMHIIASSLIKRKLLPHKAVFAAIPVSKLINKRYDQFFGQPISKNTFANLLKYLNDVTISLTHLLSSVDVSHLISNVSATSPVSTDPVPTKLS